MAQKSAQPVGTVEHIPASEHGRGFPPFDAQTFASQLFWFALAFIALYLLMSRIALLFFFSILEACPQRVDSDLEKALRLKWMRPAAIGANEKGLKEWRGRAQPLANERSRSPGKAKYS